MPASPQDNRGFFVLPQRYEGGGYYTYGTPGQGKGQYAHPRMITLLLLVGYQWSQLDGRKFGVGNISLANGADSSLIAHIGTGCRQMSAQSGETAVKSDAASTIRNMIRQQPLS